MDSPIKTLVQLQEEKKRLKMQMEVCKREFVHSFGYTKTQTRDFLVNKVALPAGALGLASIGINKLTSSNNNDTKVVKVKNDNSFFLKMMPIVLPLIRAYFSIDGKKIDPAGLIKKVIAPKQETITER